MKPPMRIPMKDQTLRGITVCICAAMAMLSLSNASRAATTAVKEGDKVVLQNELVKVEYDLTKGTYSAYNLKDKTSNLMGAALQINDDTSDANGLTRTYHNSAVQDELGTGLKVTVTTSAKGHPDLILELCLYDGKSFIVLNGGVKNTLQQPLVITTINPLHHAKAFDGVSGKADLRKDKVSSSIAHLYQRPRVWLEGFSCA